MLCPTASEASGALLAEPDCGGNGLEHAGPTFWRKWRGDGNRTHGEGAADPLKQVVYCDC